MNDAKCQPMRLLKKAAALFVLLTYHACLIAFAGAGVLVLAGAFVERFFYSFILSFFLVYAASPKKSAFSVLYNALLLSCIFSILYTYFIATDRWASLIPLSLLVFAGWLIANNKTFIAKILLLLVWFYFGAFVGRFQAFSFLEGNTLLTLYKLFTGVLLCYVFLPAEDTLRISKTAFLSFFVAELTLIRFFIVFEGPDEKATQKILASPFVKPVITLLGNGSLEQALRRNPARFVQESCDGKDLLLFFQISSNPNNIFRMNRQTKEITGMSGSAGVGDNVFQNCKNHLLYFPALRQNRVLIFDEKDLARAIRVLELPKHCEANDVLADAENKKVIAACGAGNLLIYDEKTSKFDTVEKKLTVMQFYRKGQIVFYAKGALYVYDYLRRRLEEIFHEDSGHLHLDADPGNNTVFLTSPTGDLYFLETARGEKTQKQSGTVWPQRRATIKAKLYLEPFIRYVRFDEKRELHFVAGYFNGNIYVIDTKQKKILHKFYGGTKIHSMTFSQDRARLYFASSQGIFYVDLTQIEKTWVSP